MTDAKRLGEIVPHVNFNDFPPPPPKRQAPAGSGTSGTMNQERIGWDKVGCTYWWQLNPDFSHKKWFKPIEQVNGYSKKQGQNEAKDKNLLLIGRIIMLCQHEYIQSSRRAEIFKRPLNKPLHFSDDQSLVVFYDRGKVITWNNYVYSNFPKEVVKYLLQIDQIIKSGKTEDLKYLLPRKSPAAVLAQKEQDKNKLNFQTPDHVHSWATYQVQKKGADFKTVSEFADAYIKKHFPDHKP